MRCTAGVAHDFTASSECRNEPDARLPLLAYAQQLAEKGAQKRVLSQSDPVQHVMEEAETGSDVILVRHS